MSIEKLTLIVPGLLDTVAHLDKIPARELPEFSSFSRLLSRGKLHRFAARTYYFFLFDYFSIAPQDPVFPAVAAVDYYYQFHQQEDDTRAFQEPRWVMRADPCFMAPDRDQLVLLECDRLELSYSEAQQLVAEINTFYQTFTEENFWKLELSPDEFSPLSWFLTSSKPISIQTYPSSFVKGSAVKSFLLRGKNQTDWLNLFNEFQMILHKSELNSCRRNEGKVPINSVWFWGAGRIINPSEDIPQVETGSVFCDDPVVKGLSQLSHFTIHDLPHNMDELFMVKSKGNAVVVMDHLAESVRHADVYAWLDLMQQIEKDWLQPLLQALINGRLHKLVILTPAGLELSITRKQLRRWWKKDRNYMDFINIHR